MHDDDATPAGRDDTTGLLSAADIRELAERHGVRPTKTWGQNFVIDPNTVRKIVRLAGVVPVPLVLHGSSGVADAEIRLDGAVRLAPK